MKIRTGFISNSSSTSFLVFLLYRPRTRNSLKNMMFKGWSEDAIIKSDIEGIPSITIGKIVDRVFLDIRNSQGNRLNNNLMSVFGGYIEEIDREGTPVNNLYKKSYEAFGSEIDLYHSLGRKYGYDKETNWKKDLLYSEYLKRKEANIAAHDKWKIARENAIEKWYKTFTNKNKKCKFRHVFEYGDRYNEYMLENSDIFRNVPHLVISNH